MASLLNPTCSRMRRLVSSQRNTPANPLPKGTTALLKILLEVGSKSRGIMGFATLRHNTSLHPAGRSSQGIITLLLILISFSM